MAKPHITSLAGLHDEDYITITDVAAILKISYSKAYESTMSGEIEYTRHGKAIRIEVRAFRAYLEQSRRGGPARRTPHSFITIQKRAG